MEFTHGNQEEVDEEGERERNKLHAFLPINTSAPAPSTAVQKEHMFDKVVTPSDVGKLNRLVIPKQHAEKHFPLDASTHDRGLLLNFEDRNGKPWHFRYSYWNSSQSYVMTKGWSRFVKEKRLDAGDTVSFCRGTGDTASHRLFIDWKRRPEPENHHHHHHHHQQRFNPSSSSSLPHPYLSFARSSSAPWAISRLFVPHAPTADYFYLRSPPPMVLDSVPVTVAKKPKRLRLFGVNLEPPREAADNTTAASSAEDSRGSPPPPPPLPLDPNML